MNRIRMIAVAAALAGAAALFPGAASAGGNVAWSVSIGGPGFAVSAGQPAFIPPAAVRPLPVVRPVVVRPMPVVVRPAFVRVVVAPRPVWIAPRPVWVTPQPIVPAPRFVATPTVAVRF